MRLSSYALPTVLLSQLASAAPASIAPDYDVSNPRLDPEGNKLGAVASESDICTNIGGDVLKAGGNAADSTVATVLCVGVIGMYHSGIGGGGFMLVRSSNGSYEFIDFRETAPAAAFQDMYNNNTNASLYGGLASGVPGELRGLAHLHDNYGSLPWKELVLPAVKVARDGWPVNDDLITYMDSAVSGIDNFLVNDPNWAIDFAPNGTRLELGDTITRKRYAATLEMIAEHGVDAFYEGPIAKTLINAIQATNGTMTLEDLKHYTVAIRPEQNITYRDYKVHGCGAPSSGVVGLSILKIMEGYTDIGQAATLNLSTHYVDEAMRFAYGQRSELGDPLFLEGMEEYQADMLSPETVAAVRAKISPLHTLNVSAYDPSGFESLETPGTSAVVAADVNGLAIALTTTVNTLFGSKVLVPETGIIANNEMNDFSIPGSSNAFGYIPSPANYVRPGKRPLSSITPTIVEHANGSLYYLASAAGGSRILTSVLQNVWHVLDQNMTAVEALAQPRLHDQLVPNQVSFEYTYNNETVAFMKSLGHNVTWVAPGQSTGHALRLLPNGTFEAASEPRQKNSGGIAV
ncbi:Glutathione hydrolase proenzyme [Fulvia fulva]|uniref:Glutathione hydrolase n=1 Tax=Passalora fulva TaxID=5499 RepID=A0A9Q8LHU9_PASFU|nr:Glutathione hydrolase proenzyme [Fulvia fulva]KAK4615605.1 Glutathione hydrolase proenzyme [Fulvia fulva]KAK4616547.1 Glutathione hydrolase proenzyme [Fulvia fulva]UJO16898.1 Glutathione hydrolase proenzyme [Fulvia fulva]WPV19482.1 Glutathione hydrolase proenzyme [Fulvia fulva]WPV34004.1 Glutathione hydrolase proenzyme [Fulvia fulva]